MKIKKIIAMALSFILIVLSSTKVYANQKEDINIDKIINNLETIDPSEMPEGVTPLEFASEDDFLDFYLATCDGINIVMDDNCGVFENLILPFAYIGNYPGTYSTRKDLIKIGASITYINLTTNYTYATENTYGPIQIPRNIFTNASCAVSLNGLTLGIVLSSTNNISTYSGNTCSSIATGIAEYYVIIEGGIKYYTENFTISHTFSI